MIEGTPAFRGRARRLGAQVTGPAQPKAVPMGLRENFMATDMLSGGCLKLEGGWRLGADTGEIPTLGSVRVGNFGELKLE